MSDADRGRPIPNSGQRRRRFPGSGTARRVATFAAGAWLAAGLGIAPARAADPARGATLYSRHCGACHGSGGEPVWPGAPDFRRPGALMKSDAQLLTLLERGRGVMPGYLGVLKERELLDLTAHLRTFIR